MTMISQGVGLSCQRKAKLKVHKLLKRDKKSIIMLSMS